MATPLFILSDSAAFDEGPRDNRGPGYNPYYRFVICRALLVRLVYSPKTTQQELVQLLDQTIRGFAGAGVIVQDFFEVFPINYQQRPGFVVVDKTDGCFPLVLYPDRPQKGKEDRGYAFCQSLIEVRNNIAQVESLLRGKALADWNQNMRTKLKGMLPPPRA